MEIELNPSRGYPIKSGRHCHCCHGGNPIESRLLELALHAPQTHHTVLVLRSPCQSFGCIIIRFQPVLAESPIILNTTNKASSSTPNRRLMDTPVRDMPSHAQHLVHELLAEIFLFYQAEGHSPRGLPSHFLLGQVCSTWRHVVHSTPKLWTVFTFPRYRYRRREVEEVSFAKAWLSRAHPHPLYVAISSTITPVGTLSHVVDAILQSADRLQDLRLHLPFLQFQPLIALPAGSMTLLESVELVVNTSNYVQEVQEVASWAQITAFAEAPRLQSVTLSSMRRGLFGFDIQMPWSQLTKLEITEESLSANKCRDAFLKCTNLVDCTLTMDAWVGFIPSRPIVVLPQLRKLSVTFNGPAAPSGHLIPFFQPLNLPALKDLTVATFGCAWSHQVFMEFMLRSSFDLECLCFICVEIRSDELLLVLPHMPSLIELKIELTTFEGINGRLFDALRYRAMGGPHLLPNLKKLFICESSGDGIDDNSIANMIESRWWTDDVPREVMRIEDVYVRFDDRDIDVNVKERLEHCRQEGLILHLLN